MMLIIVIFFEIRDYKWANALVPPTPIWRAMVMEPSEPMAVTGSMSIQVRAM
jgi:hypothetical protein